MMPWDISMRKTLSEVLSGINQMLLTGYAPHDYSPEHILSDAKSYLTDYKELANDSAEFAEWKENPPLTWDELKQMVEEPVWIEYEHSNHRDSGKRWFIIKWFGDLMGEIMAVHVDGIYFDKDSIGKTWNAYRRERTE